MPERVAAIITVEEYDDDLITDLIGCFKDGWEFCHLLRNIGYNAQHIHQKDDDYVVEALEEMVSGLGEDDLFLFYFGGHGYVLDGSKDQLLLCPKAKYRYTRLGYDHDSLKQSLVEAILDRPGLNRMFIFDTCRTRIHKTKGVDVERLRTDAHIHNRNIGNKPSSSSGSFARLNSCSTNQQAGELPRRRHGLFTAALLDVFNDAQRGGYELYANSELKDRIQRRMQDLALEEGIPGQQNPAIYEEGSRKIMLIEGRMSRRRDADGLTVSNIPKLHIRSLPTCASIQINEEYIGISPLEVELDIGCHTIIANKKGYCRWEKRVDFYQESSSEELLIQLEPQWTSYRDGRFNRYKDTGVILDKGTDLKWIVGPDRDTTHYEAESWIERLGENWRLAKTEELLQLYQSGIRDNCWSPFDNSGWFIWAAKEGDEESTVAPFLCFGEGDILTSDRAESDYFRAFAVCRQA